MSNNIIILYETSRGTAEQAALWMAEEIPGATVINLKKDHAPENLDEYDKIVLGSGMCAGDPYGKVKKFIKKNRDLLLTKELHLFITHLEEGEGIEKDFKSAYDEEILAHATQKVGVGGRLDFDKLNIFLKLLMRMIVKKKDGEDQNVDSLSEETSREFARNVLK
jgi:menaquinone-dependent protoporphyrinogen oxidase